MDRYRECGRWMIETHTHLLRRDEPVYEMVVVERDNGDFVTRLKVLRGSALVTAEINHGPSPEYTGKIPPLFMAPQGAEDVAFMLDESARHRKDLRYWKYNEEMRQGSTLIKDVIRQEEEALSVVRNRSTFGPHQTTERNGHNHTQVVRDFMDARAAKTGKRLFNT